MIKPLCHIYATLYKNNRQDTPSTYKCIEVIVALLCFCKVDKSRYIFWRGSQFETIIWETNSPLKRARTGKAQKQSTYLICWIIQALHFKLWLHFFFCLLSFWLWWWSPFAVKNKGICCREDHYTKEGKRNVNLRKPAFLLPLSFYLFSSERMNMTQLINYVL